MNPTGLKVAERLCYENLLMVQGIMPRRRRITLDDFLAAAKEELRLYEILPTILIHKPTILTGLRKDLKKLPGLKGRILKIIESSCPPESDFYGVTAKDCRLAAESYRAYLRQKQSRNRTRLFNLRMNEGDWMRLTQLSQKLGTGNHSETIRQIIKEKIATLGVDLGGA